MRNELNPKDILSQHGVRPQKGEGQNFLVSQRVLENFLQAAELKPKDVVLEVGAGTGIITVELARRVKKVIAVERDPRMVSILNESVQNADVEEKVEIVNADVLDLQATSYQLRAIDKILGAIPYQITSPLLHKLLKLENPPQLMVFIVQNEVAEKIAAQPPRATYLSNFVQSLAEVELVGRPIGPSAFWPSPKVRSRIIKLKATRFNKLKAETDSWEAFLHRGSRHPRKMLKSSFDEAQLEEAGIDPRSRPQELELKQWQRLFQKISSLHRK